MTGDEQVRGVLAAIAPIAGTARVASGTGKLVLALALGVGYWPHSRRTIS